MGIPKNNALTPCGVARLMARAIPANFAPTHQQLELERLVEYMQDLAVSRANEAELPNSTSAFAQQARRDAEWLDAIASELEERFLQPNNVPKN